MSRAVQAVVLSLKLFSDVLKPVFDCTPWWLYDLHALPLVSCLIGFLA